MNLLKNAFSNPMMLARQGLDKILKLLKNVSNKGFFHLLSANFLVQFLGFGSQLLVVKFLSPSQIGYIKVIQSYTSIFCILACFGFNSAVLKLCSEQIDENSKRYILKKSCLYSLITSTSVIIIFIALTLSGFLGFQNNIKHWAVVYAFSIPAMVYTVLFMVYLQALKKIKKMAKIQTILELISFVIVISSTYLFNFKGFIISTAIFFYIGVIPLFKSVKEGLFKSSALDSDRINKAIFYMAKYSLAVNLIVTIGNNIDILLLNKLIRSRAEIGYYGIASIFVLGLNQITATVQSVTTPYFSERSNNRKEFVRILFKYQIVLIALSFGITIFASFFIPLLINIVYGKSYALSGSFFRILVWRYFFWSCFAITNVAVLGLGMMRSRLFAVLANFSTYLIFGYIGIKMFSTIGAACSQVIANLFMIPIMFYTTKLAINKKFDSNKLES